MTRLKNEYSMENLLFLTIMLQWQDYLINRGYWSHMSSINNNNNNCKVFYVGFDTRQRIILPSTVPISPVIYQLNKNSTNITFRTKQLKNRGGNKVLYNYNPFCKVFIHLYKQYIETNRAPFEINIGSQLREQMKQHYLFIITRINESNLLHMQQASVASETDDENDTDGESAAVAQLKSQKKAANGNHDYYHNVHTNILDVLSFIKLWNHLVFVGVELLEGLCGSLARYPELITN